MESNQALITETFKSPETEPSETRERKTITTKPPKPEKNPKRVAAGKRLSEISRRSKLARQQNVMKEETSETELNIPSLVQVSTVVGIGVGIATMYQMIKNYHAKDEEEKEEPLTHPESPAKPSPVKPSPLRLDSEL